ncbi:hypothetical protein BGX38DRAFT_1316730 [Terfezia claveryi]|nr:hypothetical protein BGX38DRAFT_1316730 [Terfezia claveryi]
MPAKRPTSPTTPTQNFLRRSTGSSPRASPRSRSSNSSPDDKWERLYRGVPFPVDLASPQPYHPKVMSKLQIDVLVKDIPSEGDPKCEPEPPIETFQSMKISELPIEAPKDKEVSNPEIKVLVVDFPSMVISKKTEWKTTVKESSPSKETPKSKVKAAVQKIEEKVSEELK